MQRNLARFLFLDPTFAIVLAGLLIVGGLLSFSGMVRENNPDLAIPQATIVTEWPGASPEQVEKDVTKYIEDEIRTLPGLKDFSSSSRNSVSVLSVQFQPHVEIAFAMQQLRARVDAAAAKFPRDVKRPEIEQVSVNDLPIMTLVVYGDVDMFDLNVAADRLKRELEQLSEVRKANLQGARNRAVHVRLDPARIRSLGLSPTDVRDRIDTANRDLAWGALESDQGTLPLYLQGRFASLDAIKEIPVVRLNDERVIRLGELGRVFIGLDQGVNATHVSLKGSEFRRAISISVLKRPGADTLATIDRVSAFLETYTQGADWPVGMQVAQLSDEGEIIRASFSEVTSNLLQGVLAVFAILMIALTWREATVAAFALPITLLAALLVVNLFGFTLNTLVILGMVIALGILVDVFILVMEGMHDGIYVRGESFDEAALATVKAYLMPAVAGQVTTILAMAPLMAIGGVDGKFIRLIPFTAIACLIASLVIAFVVCIPLSRLVLGREAGRKAPKTLADRVTEKASGWLCRRLEKGPLKTKRRAALTVGLALVAFFGAIIAADELPSIVYPKEDRRALGITIELRPDATVAESERAALAAGQYLRTLEYLQSVTIHAGERSPFALNTIEEYLLVSNVPYIVGASVLFVPKEEREKLAFQYLEEIRAGVVHALRNEPGVLVRLTPDLGGATGADPVQIEIRGEDPEVLRDIADAMSLELASMAGVTDVRDTLGAFQSEARFETDGTALNFYRLDEGKLLDQVRIAMTADKIGTFKMPGTEPDLDIRLGTDFASRDGETGGPREIYELETLTVISDSGERVPFKSLVDLRFESIPTALLHVDGRRSVTIKARLSGEVTSDEVAARIGPRLEQISRAWPDGYSYRVRGEVESAAETYANVGTALLAAVLLVFAVLSLQFGSFRLPAVIMVTAPLGLTGVGFGFYALGIPISFPALIGVIALIGIVVNDAIVMVEVITTRLRNGMSLVSAAAHGASDRLRPILTTSVTTIVGLLPLALSSPAWYPLCMAVILGLLVATVLALVVVPCLYVLVGPRPTPEPESDEPPTKATAQIALPLWGSFITNGLGMLAAGLVIGAFPWFWFTNGGTATTAGLIAAVFHGGAALGLFGGGLVADRVGPRPVLLWTDAASAGAFAAAAASVLFAGGSIWPTVGLITLGLMLGAPGNVVQDSRVPALARMAGMPLGRANGLRDLTSQAGQVIGPIIGVLLVDSAGLEAVLLIASVTLVLAFGLDFALFPAFRNINGHGADASAGALTYIRRNSGIQVVIVLAVLVIAALNAIDDVVGPSLALARNTGATGLSAFLGLLGGGALIAVLLYMTVGFRYNGRWLFLAGLAIATAGLVLIATPMMWGFYLGAVLLGLGLGPLWAIVLGAVQRAVPIAMRGAVIGLLSGAVLLAQPLASALVGPVVDAIGPSFTILGFAVLIGGATMVAFLIKDLEILADPKQRYDNGARYHRIDHVKAPQSVLTTF